MKSIQFQSRHCHRINRVTTSRSPMALCSTCDNWWADFYKEHSLFDHYVDSVFHKHGLCHHHHHCPKVWVHWKPCCSPVVEPESVPIPIEVEEPPSEPFRVVIDAKLYAPHEIKAKTILNTIIIEAKHEEKTEGGGYTSREILRRYTLPDDNDIDRVTCTLGSDGNLTVTAPKKKQILKPGEKIIPIKKL